MRARTHTHTHTGSRASDAPASSRRVLFSVDEEQKGMGKPGGVGGLGLTDRPSTPFPKARNGLAAARVEGVGCRVEAAGVWF